MNKTERSNMYYYRKEFLEWMAMVNLSQATIRNRKVYLGYFFTWCEERGINDVFEITRPIAERYQKYLFHYKKVHTNKPLTVGAQYARLTAVRAFFKWLARKNLILCNPTADLDLPKLGKPLPKASFSASEAETVLAVPDIHDTIGLRDRAILEVLYSTGIRRMEVINLSIYDLNRDHGTLMVRMGKGNKDRVVPIGDRAVQWLDKYLYETRPQLVCEPDDHYMFLTENGDPFTLKHMSWTVKKIIDQADTNKKGSCHMFRHTMATLMLRNGADITFIQQILGHASIETTQIYASVSIDQIKNIHTATHPAKATPRSSRPNQKSDND